MSDNETITIAHERYALARHGLPLAGRSATPIRAHWLPAAIKNPVAATPAAVIAEPLVHDAAADTSDSGDWWNMEVSELDTHGDDRPSEASAMSTVGTSSADASRFENTACASAIPTIPLMGVELPASVQKPSKYQELAADGSEAGISQAKYNNDQRVTGPVAARTSAKVGKNGMRIETASGPEAESVPDDTHHLRSTTVDGIRRKGRITAYEPIEAVLVQSAMQAAAADDAVSRAGTVASTAVAIHPKAAKPFDSETIATISLQPEGAGLPEQTNVFNASNAISPTSAGQGSRDAKSPSIVKSRQLANPQRTDVASSLNPPARTVEMGLPTEMPLNRDRDTAPFRAPSSAPMLDAARIASLLAPLVNATGPSVTIDRVQVTVQAPPLAKPASNSVQQPMPSQQSPAAPRAQPNATSYRNPWASYFTRRD